AFEKRVERGEMRKAVAPLGGRIDGGDEFQRGVLGERGKVPAAGDLAQANQHDTNGWSAPARLRHSGTTRACGCSAAATSGLRSGSANGAASISKTSPASVSKLSAKLAVAVPKKCTCTSPGRRNRPYLKCWCSRLAIVWDMLSSPVRKGFSQATAPSRRIRLVPRMSCGNSPTRSSAPSDACRSFEWASHK